MNHHNRVLIMAAALSVAATVVPLWAAPSAIDSGAPASASPAGLEFTLKLPTGKTSFRQGETIPLSLSFVNKGPQTLYLNEFYQPPRSLMPLASFEVEPKEGTSDPLADLPVPTFISVAGAIPSPVRLEAIATQEPFSLNEYVRFDRPGTYTIRATTTRVFAKPEGTAAPRTGRLPSGLLASGLFSSGKIFTTTSEPISLRIVPADPKWQAEQVEAWRALWAKQKPDADGFGWAMPPGVAVPANDLRFLNTRAAVQAMLDRLGQDIAPRSSGSEAYFWRSGLIGFSDRLWLIGAMKSAMKRPDYPITQGLLDNLATLQTLQSRTPDQKSLDFRASDQVVLADWNLTFDSLAPKKGRARAMTVHSLLETAWQSRLESVPAVQRRLAQVEAMAPDVFNALPPLPQQYLLDDRDFNNEWKHVKSPRFVAPLVRAWQTVPQSQGWGRERGELILRHLVELDPKAARPLILREMAAPAPRVSFKVLSLLPDKRLPQLQNLWWTHLTEGNGADQDTAALLIGRYANNDLKAKVQKEFAERKRDHMLSTEVKRGLSRYLSRTQSS